MGKATIYFDANLRQQIIQYLIANASRIQGIAVNNIADKLEYDFKCICDNAIDDYYQDYDPFVYDREETLYEVGRTERNKDGLSFYLSSKNLSGHRVGNDYIYDIMFTKGYHGGAPHDGDYYWRYPGPEQAKRLGVKPFSTWYPYGPAKRSASPHDKIIKDWNEYATGEGREILQNELIKIIKQIIMEVKSKL